MGVSCLIGSCAGPAPYAASNNLTLTPEEEARKATLSAADQARARRALVQVAGDHRPVDPPRAAAAGVRWEDVALAMRYATEEAELGIARTLEESDRFVFLLRTVDDRPGQIVIRKTADERVYEAEAVIGRFENDVAKAEALVAAFDRQMRAFGRKRRLAFEID